ncbi:MAG: hypothetical protein ACFB3T_10265 [Geminicoccaceae bacterium]
MPFSDIDYCAAALVKIGARPISAFNEPGAEAEVARTLYPMVRDSLLAAHPWTFATRQAELVEAASAPPADFAHAFQLPADFLKALSVGQGGFGRGVVYRLAGDQLHCDADTIVLTYVAQAPETLFPASFVDALCARLAAEFCIPLTENSARAETLFAVAERSLQKARSLDSLQDTPARIDDFSLIRARFA